MTEPAHLSTLHVAFSRADAGRKVYVQDKLMAASKDVYAIMKGSVGANQGRIYVCGDAKGKPACPSTLDYQAQGGGSRAEGRMPRV